MGDQVTLHETITDGITVTDERQASHNYSERARRNLWLQMSRMGTYSEHNEVPIMVRGEGTRVYDANGTEYFDGLSGLFTNMLGHGRADIAAAAAEQMTTMAFFPLWTYAHPKAIELAEKIASLAPGDLNRVFFTSGGAEANESAWKLARQYHKMRGDTRSLQGHQSRRRLPRHHARCANDHLARGVPQALRTARARCREGAGPQLLPGRATRR